MKQKNQKVTQISAQILQQNEEKEKKIDIFLFFLLLFFGMYQAVIYWGHKVVPHPDFTGFTNIGRQVLSFRMPADFKRVPLLGILQILFGKITGGLNPDLTGAWLLNSIAHSLTAVLLWLVGRKIIGRAAIWFAIIAIINPWGLQLLTEGIAETTLLFFVLATLYLIFIRSRWAYLLAALTSMIRYEGGALILCAFIFDMIEGKNKKERILSFICAAAASVPLLLWLSGTVFLQRGMGATHYFKFFTKEYKQQVVGNVAEKTGFVKNADLLWQVGFYQLFLPSPQASQESAISLMNLSKFFVSASFLFGCVFGLIKRQWKILVLLLFIMPYFCLHAAYPFLQARYYATIFAIVLLICIYGLQSYWNLINEKIKVPAGITILLQSILLVVTLFWSYALVGYLPRLAQMSKASESLPYVSILVVLAVLTTCFLAFKNNILKKVAVLMLMILIIVSNQFAVAGLVGNGQNDIEFKYLTDWYVQNAKSGEKLVSTMANLLASMAPKYADDFVAIDDFSDANSPQQFIDDCYKKNITYVAWDSRIGLAAQDEYYKIWKMQNLAELSSGRDSGPFQFIILLKANDRRFIYVYKLRPR